MREALQNDTDFTGNTLPALAYIGVSPPNVTSRIMAKVGSDGSETSELVPAWWASQRDTMRLRAYVDSAKVMERSTAAPAARRLRASYDVAAGEAYFDLARGDSSTALRKFLALPDSLAPFGYVDRWTRARLLEANGRYSEALPLLRERLVGAETAFDMLMALERGKVAERLGMHNDAVRAYQFVVDAWGRGEPPVQPYVTLARAGLTRLAARRQ
jgi:hypothetical protein